MRSHAVLAVLVLALASVARAAPAPDPVLTKGLQAFVTNGLPVCLSFWYAGRPKLAAALEAKIAPAIRDLGAVIDTEVVATQTISRRVTRYYVAVYFDRGPLWIRIERYAGRDRSFYLPLKFSLDPDDILPGYLTDFVP
jgi:hypothetical protein